MDLVPFLIVDLEMLDEQSILELEKFHKENFNQEKLYDEAKKTKYLAAIKEWFKVQASEVSDEFIKAVLNDVYTSKRTQKVIEQFRPIVKRAFAGYINDVTKERMTELLAPKANEKKEFSKYYIDGLIDIFKYKKELIKVAKMYEDKK